MSVLGVNGWNKLFSLKNTRRRNLAVYECIQQSSYNNIITASRTTVGSRAGRQHETDNADVGPMTGRNIKQIAIHSFHVSYIFRIAVRAHAVPQQPG